MAAPTKKADGQPLYPAFAIRPGGAREVMYPVYRKQEQSEKELLWDGNESMLPWQLSHRVVIQQSFGDASLRLRYVTACFRQCQSFIAQAACKKMRKKHENMRSIRLHRLKNFVPKADYIKEQIRQTAAFAASTSQERVDPFP